MKTLILSILLGLCLNVSAQIAPMGKPLTSILIPPPNTTIKGNLTGASDIWEGTITNRQILDSLSRWSSSIVIRDKGKRVLEIITSRNGVKCQDTIIKDSLQAIRALLTLVDKANKRQEIQYKIDALTKAWEFKSAADKLKFNRLRQELKKLQ